MCAYPRITGVEGISEAVHAPLLQDGYPNEFIAGRQQEEGDRGQHTDLIHVRPGLIYRHKQAWILSGHHHVILGHANMSKYFAYLAVSARVQMPGCSSQGQSTVPACSPPGPEER